MPVDDPREGVTGDAELARRLGVRGTPTMFLDGRRITELCDGEVFWKAVAESSAASHALSTGRTDELSALTANDPPANEGGQRP